MPRSETIFRIVAPETPGSGQVWAEADSIFIGTDVPKEMQLIPMPERVGERELYAGILVKGMGHIFVASGAQVRPHDLQIIEECTPVVTTSEWE